MEADLAYAGFDLRDLHRRGSGLTPRRLYLLIRRLPPESWTWALLEEEKQKALKPKPDQIRERQAYYASRQLVAEEPE